MANKNFFQTNFNGGTPPPRPPEFMPDRNKLVYQHNKTFVSAELIDIGTRTKVNYNEWITDGLNNAYWAPVQNNGKFFKIRNDGTVEGYVGPAFTTTGSGNNTDAFVYNDITIIDLKTNTNRCQDPAIFGNKMYCMPWKVNNKKMAYIDNGVVSEITTSVNLNTYFNYFHSHHIYDPYTEPYVANDGTVYYCSTNTEGGTACSTLLKFKDNIITDILPYFKKHWAYNIRDKNNNIYYIQTDIDPNNPKTQVTKITPDNIVTTNIYEFKDEYNFPIYDEKLDIYYLISHQGTGSCAILKDGILTKSDVSIPNILLDGNPKDETNFRAKDIATFRDINDNIYLMPYYTDKKNASKKIIKFSNGEVSLVDFNTNNNVNIYTRSIPYINPTTKSFYIIPCYAEKGHCFIIKIDYFTSEVIFLSFGENVATGINKISASISPVIDQLGYTWWARTYAGCFYKTDTGSDIIEVIKLFNGDANYMNAYISPTYLDNGDIIVPTNKRYVYKISYGELTTILNNTNMSITTSIVYDFLKPYMDKNRNYYYVSGAKILKITQAGVASLINGENVSSSAANQYGVNTQFMDKEKNFYAIPMNTAVKKILKIEYETGNISYIDIPGLTTAATHFNNNKPFIDNNGNMYFTPLATGSKILKLNFN